MHQPATSGELQQRVFTMRLMRSPIPTLTTITRSLSDFMESVYVKKGSGKKSAVTRVILDKAKWSRTEFKVF